MGSGKVTIIGFYGKNQLISIMALKLCRTSQLLSIQLLVGFLGSVLELPGRADRLVLPLIQVWNVYNQSLLLLVLVIHQNTK